MKTLESLWAWTWPRPMGGDTKSWPTEIKVGWAVLRFKEDPPSHFGYLGCLWLVTVKQLCGV